MCGGEIDKRGRKEEEEYVPGAANLFAGDYRHRQEEALRVNIISVNKSLLAGLK